VNISAENIESAFVRRSRQSDISSINVQKRSLRQSLACLWCMAQIAAASS